MDRPSPRMAMMLFVSGVLLVFVLGVSFLLEGIEETVVTVAERPRTEFRVEASVWSDAAAHAVELSCARADGYRLLAGRFVRDGGAWRAERVPPVWRPFVECGRPVTLVIEAGRGEPGGAFGAGGSLSAAVVAREIDQLWSTAPMDDVAVAGIDLDFACPPDRLGEYAAFLEALRPDLHGVRLAITAEPPWLGAPAFERVLRSADAFLLRVCPAPGADGGGTEGDPAAWCGIESLSGDLEAATAAGTPFWLLLPARAVSRPAEPGRGVEEVGEGGSAEALLWPDASVLAALIRHVHGQPAGSLRGVVWESLPVGQDPLNWPWSTLEAAMAGATPSAAPGRNP